MDESERTLLVLRHGETFLKRANRRRFEQQLQDNIRAALQGLGEPLIKRAQGRFFVYLPEDSTRRALHRLEHVFGLSSVSLAREIPNQPEGFIEHAAGAAKALLAQRARPASFKVRARRANKRFPLTSPEIARQLGGTLALALELRVDLFTPELTVGVEVGDQSSFVFVERLDGAGGLPVGSSGRALVLLSGGIDSPVAGYLAQKRGCRLRAVYFHSPPHTSELALDKVERLAVRLAAQQGCLPLHVVPFTAIQEHIRDRAQSELLVVLYRRAMMHIAQRLARLHHCGAIVTGESLGQVASQTMENLGAIADAVELPVLRPLVAYDKHETIALARKIDTFEVSIEPHADCCSLFVPRHPATRVSLERARAAEQMLDLSPLIEQALCETSLSKVMADF